MEECGTNIPGLGDPSKHLRISNTKKLKDLEHRLANQLCGRGHQQIRQWIANRTSTRKLNNAFFSFSEYLFQS